MHPRGAETSEGRARPTLEAPGEPMDGCIWPVRWRSGLGAQGRRMEEGLRRFPVWPSLAAGAGFDRRVVVYDSFDCVRVSTILFCAR